MDEKLADRDRLWCRALVATLGIDEIARVTAEFNRIRPDAAQQSVQADGRVLCACIPPLADTNSMGKCEACGCARR